MIRIGMNGFGRIGRLILRSLIEANKEKEIQIVGINDLTSAQTHAHLLKYDSVHGIFPKDVSHSEDTIDIGYGPIKIYKHSNPLDIPWKDLNVDLVMECTGIFANREGAQKHIDAGAPKVLISAPADNVDLTVVYGVNHHEIKNDHKIISNASCTTNCLAPVAFVLNNSVGIEKGYMTTIHSYTGDQNLVDTAHKDLRRARAGALSMIPTSTGAAKAVGLVLPELKGKLDGTAIRVPTPNVSVVDFKFVSKKQTTVEEINRAIIAASQKGSLKDILVTNNLPLVSCDFNHNPASSIFDLTQTQVVDGNLVRVLSWYDNEWGFSNRMIDTALSFAKK